MFCICTYIWETIVDFKDNCFNEIKIFYESFCSVLNFEKLHRLFFERKTVAWTVLVAHPVQIEGTEVRNFKDDAIVYESWSPRTRFRVWTIINIHRDIFGSANKIFQLPSYIMLFRDEFFSTRKKNLPLIFITKYNESLFPFSLQ